MSLRIRLWAMIDWIDTLVDYKRGFIELRILVWSMFIRQRRETIRSLRDLSCEALPPLIYVIAFPRSPYQPLWRAQLRDYYLLWHDVGVPKEFLLHILYERPFGEHSDREVAVRRAKSYLRRYNLGYHVDEEAILADPFKDLVARLLENPSCLWREIN